MSCSNRRSALWLVAAILWWMPAVVAAQQRTSRSAQQSPGVSSSQPSSAATTCVSEERRSAINACPANLQRMRSHASTSPPSAARADLSEHANAQANRQRTQTDLLQLDPQLLLRRAQFAQQATVILRNEVQLVVQLLRGMNRSSPNRADTLMRLAEGLQDLSAQSNAAAHALDAPIFAANQARNTAQAAVLQREQQGHNGQAREYRTHMLRALETLIADHPNYPRADAVLFYAAFAYQEAHDMDRARVMYLGLIQRFPQSQYVPNAYLSFAEFFFEQGDMASAAQFYNRVIAINTPANTVRAYAMYKMAWVEFNRQHFDDSLQQFYAVIELGRTQPGNRSVEPLVASARTELVSAYGAVFGVSRPLNSEQALNTFRRYAADDDGAFAMLERLGELYQDNGQWPNSVSVFHELMARRESDDKFCFWQGQVARAFVAMNQRDNMMREITRLIDVYDHYRTVGGRPASAKISCRNATARVVYDVASHWHLEAIGRSVEGQAQTRGTRDPQTMTRAAALYNTLLEKFPDLDQVEFADYDRRDWPTRYRIAYYAADILRDQQDFTACGPAYDRVVEMSPTGEYAEDAAYKAVLCYNDLFSRDLAAAAARRVTHDTRSSASVAQSSSTALNASPLPPRAFTSRETAMFAAFTRYVCVAGASLGNAANVSAQNEGDDPRQVLLTIQYRRAYLAYQANHFEDAAAMFRSIALPGASEPSRGSNDPENLREIAADLYLDSLSVMGLRWSPPRAQCFDVMEHDLPLLKENFCNSTARPQHREFCDRMDVLGCQILRKKAESLGASGQFRQAGEAIVDLVRNHPECRAREEVHVDELLYNVSIYFDSANMLGRSMRIREALVATFLPRNSPWAQRALYRLGGNYHAIQVFSRAAEYYERYAEYVGANRTLAVQTDAEAVTHAADALRQATIFRIGLGEEEHALSNANRFGRLFGSDPQFRAQAAAVQFSIGQIYADRAERFSRDPSLTADDRRSRMQTAWRDVVRHYTDYVNRYARQGTLDQQIQGNVALGRGYLKLQDDTNANLYFRAAVAAWGDPPLGDDGTVARNAQSAGERRIREQLQGQSESSVNDAVEKSKDAAAEARFWLADAVYRQFMARHIPAYRGGNSVAAFDQWTQRTLRPFITEQRRHLEVEATAQFRRVMEMHVPNWEIAAAERLGEMFAKFAKLIREAPMPPEWNRPTPPFTEIADQYRLMLDQYTEPFITLATTGFQACVQRSTQVHWFNEWSRLCETQLNQIDRLRFPLADEVRAEPNAVVSRESNARVVFRMEDRDDESNETAAETQAH